MKLNQITLGDAYELIKQIPDKSVDLIVTDPPYELQTANGGGIAKKRNFHHELADNGIIDGFKEELLDELVRVCKKINVYLWCSKAQIIKLLDYFVTKRGCNWEMLVWAKENPTPFCGTHYLRDKEYCLYFWEEGAKVHIPFERARTVYLTKVNKQDKADYGHPTIKPLELIKTLIENSSGGVK